MTSGSAPSTSILITSTRVAPSSLRTVSRGQAATTKLASIGCNGGPSIGIRRPLLPSVSRATAPGRSPSATAATSMLSKPLSLALSL